MADSSKKRTDTSSETSETLSTKETFPSSNLPPGPGLTSKDLFGRNFQATITYCSVFWSFGMCVALLGPTLLDLGCQTSSKLDSMAWVFLAQTLSTLVGSMLGGILVDRLNPDPLLFISVIMIGVTIALIPLCHELWMLAIVLAIMGVFMGIIDTVANVSLLKIYGKLVSPFLQALHFCYGLGAFVSPIVAEPFLLNEDCTGLIENKTTNATERIEERQLITETYAVTQAPNSTIATLEEAQHKTHVKYAFWIMSFIQLPIVFLVLALLIRRSICCEAPPTLQLPKKDKTKYEDLDDVNPVEMKDDKMASETDSACCGSPRSRTFAITFLSSLLLFLFDGLQAAYGGYIYTYAVKSIAELSSSAGAYLTSVYWGSFALGRLVSIPISTRLSPTMMLLINITGCFAAVSVELSLRHDANALFICTSMFGLFLSSVYPTVIALAEQYIHMTGFVTSCVVIGAASGEMAFPVVVGRLFFAFGPPSFFIFCTIVSFVGIVVYIVLCCIGQYHMRSFFKASQGAYFWCRSCCITSSKESLLHDKANYYTTIGDSRDVVSLVTLPEQTTDSPEKKANNFQT